MERIGIVRRKRCKEECSERDGWTERAGMRPAWFFEKERSGQIITDIGSPQAEQML